MTYLGCPRIHIAGLFYTNPSNLNNVEPNYDLAKALDYNTGRYKYPNGVAQWWLQGCVVTSVVGPDGALCSESSSDALVGATVQTPTPKAPRQNPAGGYFDLAKIADLDPSMQFRSEVYGARFLVEVPGGGGFSGAWPLPPQLRDLCFFRGGGGVAGNQVAVGTWHQRIRDVQWTKPTSPSPVYDALKAQATDGLDFKMSVDLFQTTAGNEFSVGDLFGYGRLVGAIGPATAAEPCELVPGRSLYAAASYAVAAPPSVGAPFTREASAAAAKKPAAATKQADSADPGSTWNRTDGRVQDVVLPDKTTRSFLLLDLFGTIPLDEAGQGQFAVGGDLEIGLLVEGTFKPLTHGAVAFSYSKLDAATLQLKACDWPDNSAIAQVELTAGERQSIGSTPIAIRVGQALQLQENPTGLYFNADQASLRLEPEKKQTLPVYAYVFGVAQDTLPTDVSVAAQLSVSGGNSTQPTKTFSVAVANAGTSGRFEATVSTGPAQPEADMEPARLPMDSLLGLVAASAKGQVLGDQQSPVALPLIALLFWQNHHVVDDPTWATPISTIMKRYARMYPGMVSRLDIGDEGTVRTRAAALLQHYKLDRSDPAFMPVVRDMSPSMVDMMIRYLESVQPPSVSS
ncbi:hypothetical protein OAX78_01920 [Planctomycetota bacterium]|nr:hypothetical protein [Planctomycetota bacterium]